MARPSTPTDLPIGAAGKASCGCEGVVVGGVSVVTSMRVSVPCPGGTAHGGGSIAAGVIERWNKDQVWAA